MGAPAPSTLSTIGELIRRQLKSDPFHDTTVEVTIDTPAAVAKSQQEPTNGSILNLFFYRIEPSGFDAGAGANDRWYIRMHCLVTAFSIAETVDDGTPAQGTKISEGEGDLRVLGEVLRYFHEKPIIVPTGADASVGAYLQIVLTPLSSEEINQIWSTQGDVAYRPSLLYEIALLPIEPTRRSTPPLPVVAGGVNLQSGATMKAARPPPPPPPPPPTIWISPRMEIAEGSNWIPALSFVVVDPATQRKVATQSTSLKAGAGLKALVWLAGRANEPIQFVWQHINRGVWEPVSGAGGVIGDTVPTQQIPPGNGVIEPSAAAAANLSEVPVPTDLPAPLLLYAERTLADHTVLRSNPLILTVTP